MQAVVSEQSSGTTGEVDLLDIALRIREAADEHGAIRTAQVRVLGLDEIREAAGPRWPRMRERVRQGSLQILKQHSGPDDIILPAGDGFLVVLADGSEADNSRCAAMREALMRFYLGEEGCSALRAEVKTRSLNVDSFADLLIVGAETPAHAPAADEGPKATCAVFKVVASRSGAPIADMVTSTVPQGDGVRIAYDRDFIIDGRHLNPCYLDVDLALLQEYARRPKQRLGLTVHATTLQNRRSREKYLHAGRDVFAAHPPAFISAAEIERGTPLITLSEWCSILRPISPRVCLQFHHTDQAIGSVGGAGAWAAGFQLPINGQAHECGNPRIAALLQGWSKRLHAQGVRFAVGGFQNNDLVSASAPLGVDMAITA